MPVQSHVCGGSLVGWMKRSEIAQRGRHVKGPLFSTFTKKTSPPQP